MIYVHQIINADLAISRPMRQLAEFYILLTSVINKQALIERYNLFVSFGKTHLIPQKLFLRC